MTGTLAGAVLRGIRSRALLSAGSVLLIALAVGSAVLGPVFQVAVTKSYVVSRLNDAPPRSRARASSVAIRTPWAGPPWKSGDGTSSRLSPVDRGGASLSRLTT